MLKRLVVGVVGVLVLASGIGVVGATPIRQGPEARVDCWIPQDLPPQPPTVSRQRLNGQWEALMQTGRIEAQGLCVEVLPGVWVYHGDAEEVTEYLHRVNGEVLFYGKWVKWSPMLGYFGTIAWCESRGRWDAVNGMYGGIFQLDGMSPNAPAQVQLDRAYEFYDRQGWNAWRECAKWGGLIP